MRTRAVVFAMALLPVGCVNAQQQEAVDPSLIMLTNRDDPEPYRTALAIAKIFLKQ